MIIFYETFYFCSFYALSFFESYLRRRVHGAPHRKDRVAYFQRQRQRTGQQQRRPGHQQRRQRQLFRKQFYLRVYSHLYIP
jgi:hypothetical protein